MDRKSRFSLRSLWTTHAEKKPAQRKRPMKLETLEGRHLLSISPWGAPPDDLFAPAMVSDAFPAQSPVEESVALYVNTRVDLPECPDGQLSLREAIHQSRSVDGAKAIIFDASLSGQTIFLEDDLLLAYDITLDVSLLDEGVTIDLNGRQITVASGAKVRFTGLNFTSSEAYVVQEGDAWALITNLGDLVLTNCSFEDITVLMREAHRNGLINPGQDSALLGIIANEGTLTLENVTFAGNSAGLANICGRGSVYVTTTASAETPAYAAPAAAEMAAADDVAPRRNAGGSGGAGGMFSAVTDEMLARMPGNEGREDAFHAGNATTAYTANDESDVPTVLADVSVSRGYMTAQAAAFDGLFANDAAAETCVTAAMPLANLSGAAAGATAASASNDRRGHAWIYAPAVNIHGKKQEKSEDDALAEIKSLARMVALSTAGRQAAEAQPPKEKSLVPELSAFQQWQLWSAGDDLWQHETATLALSAPAEIEVTQDDTGEVRITWQPVEHATHYLVETSTDDGKTWSSDDVLCHDMDHSAILRRLASETEYLVRVTALTDDGSEVSEPSVPAEFVTGLQLESPSLEKIRTTDFQTVTLEIHDPANDAANVSGYIIEYATDPGMDANWSRENVAVDGRVVTITGLEESVVYFARLKAVGVAGVSADSEWELTDGFFTVTPLDAPMNVFVEPLAGDGGVRVTWEPVANTCEYLLEYSADNGRSWDSVSVTHDGGTPAGCTLSGLYANHVFRVTALGNDSYQDSQPSHVVRGEVG